MDGTAGSAGLSSCADPVGGGKGEGACDPALRELIDRVRAACADGTSLDVRGGGTKAWLGGMPAGEPLATTALRGISSYEPSELVVTVRAGTSLAELEAVLAEKGQCLPFEPPRFGANGTVGGMVAAGLAGPSRAAVGGVRDYVLGASLLNGRAELVSFGGQVMKNVAGYDVARLLAGSMGVLGVVCEVSLKVLPQPVATATVSFEADQDQAIRHLNQWAGKPLPLHASAWWQGTLVVRLSGAEAAVSAALKQLGGDRIDPGPAAAFWSGLRDQTDEFFATAAIAARQAVPPRRLWRLSLPAVAPPLELAGDTLLEWGGAQRWLLTEESATAVREAARAAGGHASRWRAAERDAGARDDADSPPAPPPAPLGRIHRELKVAFDPQRIFNPGRLMPGL
jgi:glycolate oxidase FAD binding subunit